MRSFVIAVCLAVLGCADSSKAAQRPKTAGAILGLVRDHHTGDPVAMADIELTKAHMQTRRAQTNKYGLYTIDGLDDGTYTLKGVFAGQPIEITNIAIKRGEATYVDFMFTLGDPQPIHVVFGDHSGEITRYRPKSIAPTAAWIEGTVSDVSTRERIDGAVVTATGAGRTEQAITDAQGRYKFDNLAPGTYTVSAYYSIGGRAQVEVQRNQIQVAAAEAVIVPLAIELSK